MVFKGLIAGAAAGAAGTTALNLVTYADMAWRGRPASSIPEQTVERLASGAGIEISGDESTRQHRLEGLGPLTGLITGVAVGAGYGLITDVFGRPRVGSAAILTAAGAMLLPNGAMVALGLTDPRSWTAAEWLSDVLPHIAYGAVTAVTYDALS